MNEAGPHLAMVRPRSRFLKGEAIFGRPHIIPAIEFPPPQRIRAVHDIRGAWRVDGPPECRGEDPGAEARLNGLHRLQKILISFCVVDVVWDKLHDELLVEVVLVGHGVPLVVQAPHGQCSQPCWLSLQSEGRCRCVVVGHGEVPELAGKGSTQIDRYLEITGDRATQTDHSIQGDRQK